jgi:hypothetical protein
MVVAAGCCISMGRNENNKNKKEIKEIEVWGWQVGSAVSCADMRTIRVCVQADSNINQIWWTNRSIQPKTRKKNKMDRPARLAFLSDARR